MPVSPLLSLQLTSRLSPPLSLRATAGAAVKSCLRSKRKQLLDTARVSKPRGNPFSFRGLRILSRFAFRMTHRLGIANTYGVRLYFRLPVIASEQSERDNPFPRGNPLPAPLHNGFSLPYNKTGVQKVYLLNSLFFTLFYHPKACFAILFCNFPFQNTKNKILI